ncbi:unnamed protein product [Adineta steineri]|uniref:NHL repeat containing protein n=1 Tax=Adineta steineri TaxID=433720 RepID=A0A815VGV4_9BILA|nr:unnamed protein product [Adineta steineri]CAF1530049.1 unnamed protein product [Adineta steineri]
MHYIKIKAVFYGFRHQIWHRKPTTTSTTTTSTTTTSTSTTTTTATLTTTSTATSTTAPTATSLTTKTTFTTIAASSSEFGSNIEARHESNPNRFGFFTGFTAGWNSNGATVAGNASGAEGEGASQFKEPYVLIFDSSNALYVSDWGNHRIQKWIIGSSVGVTVAGQADGTSGVSSTTLSQPIGLTIDSSNNMYIVDKANHRVMYWVHGASSGSMIAGTGFLGSANNQFHNPNIIQRDSSSGTLYISDVENHRIMQYLNGSSSGTVVAGGNGYGTGSTQLWKPYGFALDSSTNSLIIANGAAHTIVRWVIGDTSWTLLAGSSGVSGSSPTLLKGPVCVAVDQYENIYVADTENHRIQFFLAGQSSATTIAGITGSSGTSATQLNRPYGVTLDKSFFPASYKKSRSDDQKTETNIINTSSTSTSESQNPLPTSSLHFDDQITSDIISDTSSSSLSTSFSLNESFGRKSIPNDISTSYHDLPVQLVLKNYALNCQKRSFQSS